MAKSVEIRGIETLQRAFNVAEMKLRVLPTTAFKRFAERIKDVAKSTLAARGFIDTGALFASIHTQLINATPLQIVWSIIAGDPNISRGEGKYQLTRSKKSGGGIPGTAGVKNTEEYAEAVEDIGASDRGPAKYMEDSAKWAEQRIQGIVLSVIREAFGGL